MRAFWLVLIYSGLAGVLAFTMAWMASQGALPWQRDDDDDEF